MIIQVFNKDNQKPQKYSFTDDLVYLGRNPRPQASVTVNSHTISRNHLKIKVKEGHIQIMDLNSSNGTFLEGQKIEPNHWKTISSTDKVTVAEFQGHITFAVRQASISNTLLKDTKKIIMKSQGSDSQQRSRSRQMKSKIRQFPFKISESTLKMLKDMTVNKKSKEEKVKFLKLMGIGKADEYWVEIQQLLKQKKGIKDSKKTHDDLERQFSAARSAVEKRGLGK